VHFAIIGYTLNQASVFVFVPILALLQTTADAFTLTLTKICDFIPAFRVELNIGTTYTVIGLSLNAPLISSSAISALLNAGLFLRSPPKLICFLPELLN